MKNQIIPRESKEAPPKNVSSIMDHLFHRLGSSVVSIEGYTAVLTKQYAAKLDRKGKHYVRRIQKNLEDMGRVVRMLQECCNGEVKGDAKRKEAGNDVGNCQ